MDSDGDCSHGSPSEDLPPGDPEVAEALAEIDEAGLPHELPRNDLRGVLVRLVVSLALLALLIWQLPEVSLDQLVPRRGMASFVWILVAVALTLLAFVLQTVRWSEVSATLGLHLPFRRMFSHLLTGEFVSRALPTSFGGDVVRVVRQGNDTGDFADAFAATSIERLTGWLVLPLLSFVGLALVADFRDLGAATAAAVTVNLVTVGALTVIAWVAAHPRGAGRLVGRQGWRRYLGAVHLGTVAFRRHPTRVLRVLGAGVGFQVVQCAAVWACARSFGIPEVTFLAALAFFPPTAVVQNLPLTLGGLGVREGAFVFFFGALGVSNADAIGLGLLVYVVFVLSSLAGAPSFLRGGFAGRTGRAGRGAGAT